MNTSTTNKNLNMNNIPHRLLLQWHVTNRCNLRCSHCYQEDYAGDELEFQDLMKVLDQFKALIRLRRGGKKQVRVPDRITVTGGEPFARKDFIKLLEVFYENREIFSFAILTNGTLLDSVTARCLRRLAPSYVQVSLEGTQETHDKIRGQGSFEKAVSGLKHLVKENIRTIISFTAHRANYREFPGVARLGRKLGVSRVWSDRLVPQGTGLDMKAQMLTPEETREFFEIMQTARSQVERRWFNRTEIAMHRALQFLVAGGQPYHCSAGDTLITVQPNGDLYPCRRMPIYVGNLMQTPLVDLYYNSKLFQNLRNQQTLSDNCQGCFYSGLCRGGLKCLSYAVTGDPFQKDPGCWYMEGE
ncbi:MAG: radical SAM protein [Candidatus Aminicenantes bacterium]|nr:MAG: radical SAM protein [Candidatus Aminicenantes bacterium]